MMDAALWPPRASYNCVPLPAIQNTSAFTQTDAAYDSAHHMSLDAYSRPQIPVYHQNSPEQRAISCHEHDRPRGSGRQTHDLYCSDPSAPLLRSGRLGGQWRHIRQVTGNLGNHICFVDGTVKLKDMHLYPPFGYRNAPTVSSRLPQTARLPSAQPIYAADSIYRSRYNEDARAGKKYWYEDRPPMTLGPKHTIGSRLMKCGTGY